METPMSKPRTKKTPVVEEVLVEETKAPLVFEDPEYPAPIETDEPLEIVPVPVSTKVAWEDPDYPEPVSLTEAFAQGLLPSNLLPADQLPAVVAATPTVTPLAVVEADGQVFPPVLPYKPEEGVKALYTQEEVDEYRAKYDKIEADRMTAILAQNAQPAYDATVAPVLEEEPEDDLYGEPLSDAVIAAFGNLRK